MRTRSKLATLEFIAGLFGWVWIGSGIAALIFFVLAIFSDGSWANLFWALGAGIVTKWLARAFDDTKKRVTFESQLIAEGYSSEDAGKGWLQEYTGSATKQSEAHDAMDVIQAYGKALETDAPAPGCVADEGKLPYTKDTIKAAIVAGLKDTTDDHIKDLLKAGYIQLSQWQPGVGLTNQGLDLASFDMGQDTAALAKVVLERFATSEDWTVKADEEQKALRGELQALGLW